MLYHSAVFMPRRIRNMVPKGPITIVYSNHAMRAANTDRYGTLTLPKKIEIGSASLIEAEVYGKNLRKIVVRIPMGNRLDLCLALLYTIGNQWFCKTVWANEKTDNHATLNRYSYVQG